jgi:hypothetical protein
MAILLQHRPVYLKPDPSRTYLGIGKPEVLFLDVLKDLKGQIVKAVIYDGQLIIGRLGRVLHVSLPGQESVVLRNHVGGFITSVPISEIDSIQKMPEPRQSSIPTVLQMIRLHADSAQQDRANGHIGPGAIDATLREVVDLADLIEVMTSEFFGEVSCTT